MSHRPACHRFSTDRQHRGVLLLRRSGHVFRLSRRYDVGGEGTPADRGGNESAVPTEPHLRDRLERGKTRRQLAYGLPTRVVAAERSTNPLACTKGNRKWRFGAQEYANRCLKKAP